MVSFRWLLLAALLVSGPASAQLLLLQAGSGQQGVAGASQFLLLADGVNKVLLVNGVAKICIANSC